MSDQTTEKALIAEARTWFPYSGPNEKSLISRLADALEEADKRIDRALMWHDKRYCTYCDNGEESDCHLRHALSPESEKS